MPKRRILGWQVMFPYSVILDLKGDPQPILAGALIQLLSKAEAASSERTQSRRPLRCGQGSSISRPAESSRKSLRTETLYRGPGKPR